MTRRIRAVSLTTGRKGAGGGVARTSGRDEGKVLNTRCVSH
mgnify:CR=1 FL=1|jgi:hypothetical protein